MMPNNKEQHEELLSLYREIKAVIRARFDDFHRFRSEGTEDELFRELVFCLLTPQSGARRCGTALQLLCDRGLLFDGRKEEVSSAINTVRFKNTKAENILRARELFRGDGPGLRVFLTKTNNPAETRARLVSGVRGMGYKEAGHFMRNTGFGDDLAILDRHILRSLAALGVIDAVPPSLPPRLYLNIERKMKVFSLSLGIPIPPLDFVLWYRRTGDIYK